MANTWLYAARALKRRIRLLAVTLVLLPVAALGQSLVVEYTIGSFMSAVSLSLNASGELLVLDAGADACLRLDVTGHELSRLEGRGWGSTEFDSPTDVSGAFPLAVFVSDGKNRRVQQFDKDLMYVQTIGAPTVQNASHQTDDNQLLAHSFRPIASAESQQGELFVIDADANRIVKFTTRFKAEREFGTYASGEGRLETPTDVCLTGEGTLAVADGRRIVYFDQFGNYLFTHALPAHDSLRMASRAISSYGGDVLVTSADLLTVTGDTQSGAERISEIPRSMIMGFPVDEFRDAARTEQYWLILTPKTLLVCKRVF